MNDRATDTLSPYAQAVYAEMATHFDNLIAAAMAGEEFFTCADGCSLCAELD